MLIKQGRDAEYPTLYHHVAQIITMAGRLLDSGLKSTASHSSIIDLAMINGDANAAILNFELLLDRGIIISKYYQQGLWYDKPLTEHEKWPELLARSDEIMQREREIYLSLVAEETKSE